MSAQRIRKEIRTLLPAWVSILALVICFMLLRYRYEAMATVGTIVAFIGGCAVLAALGFGTEYDSKTLASLLSQPISRRTIWYEKMAVLVSAMFMFCFLSFCFLLVTSPSALASSNIPDEWLKVLFAVVSVPICAMGATPWLALTSRSTSVGTVLSLFSPVILVIGVTKVLGRFHIQWPGDSYYWFCITLLDFYALLLCWLGFRKFTRLQLVESRNFWERFSFSARTPWNWNVSIPSRRFSGPYARLVRKEIHLQSFSFLGALLFSIAWLLYSSLSHPAPSAPDISAVACAFYTSIMVIIIGAFSIASERSLGTIPWQFMLPVSRPKQWLVKLAVIGMTCLLLCAVPLVVFDDLPAIWDKLGLAFFGPFWILLLVVAIFSSSVSSTPVRAIIRAVAIIACTFMVMLAIDGYVSENFGARAPAVPPGPELVAQAKVDAHRLPIVKTMVIRGSQFASIALMMLFSFSNYRELNLRKKRFYLQVGTLVALAALASLLTTCFNIKINNSLMIVYQNEQPRVP